MGLTGFVTIIIFSRRCVADNFMTRNYQMKTYIVTEMPHYAAGLFLSLHLNPSVLAEYII